MTLPNGKYTIASADAPSSFLTFPDHGGSILMSAKNPKLRSVVRVTSDESGYEFEVDAVGAQQALGIFGPTMAEAGVLNADFDRRTVFTVTDVSAATKVKNTYTIATLTGSTYQLTLEPGVSDIEFQKPVKPVPKGQAWIFTDAH